MAALVDLSGSEKGEQAISLADVKETIKKAVGFKTDRDEIQVTQVKMPAVATEGADEELANHQRWQSILTLVRNASMAMVALCAFPIVWMVFRRRRLPAGVAAAPTEAPVEPGKLRLLSDELERNPEALAKILATWIERRKPATKKRRK